MIITVSINGVLRDVLSKFEQIYEKYQGKEVTSPVITPDLMKYVDFKDNDELFNNGIIVEKKELHKIRKAYQKRNKLYINGIKINKKKYVLLNTIKIGKKLYFIHCKKYYEGYV